MRKPNRIAGVWDDRTPVPHTAEAFPGAPGPGEHSQVVGMKTYTADVRRDGKFWLISVPAIGRSTQALRYRDVPAMASDLIEIMEDVGPDDYALRIKVQLPDAVKDHLARAEALREEVRRKQAEAARESREAVKRLLAEGLTQREAAAVVDMSPQRVNQLVNS